MGVAERKIREKVARRSSILAAAREVFAEKGLVGATMDEIAEKAELSKGAIYLYFPSKEELYLSVMNEGMDILIGRLVIARELSTGSVPADQALKHMAQAYYQFYVDYPDYFRIMFIYQHLGIRERVDPTFIASCDEKNLSCLNLAREVIEKGMQEGIFRPLNPWTVAILCWTWLNGIIMLSEHREHLPEKIHDRPTLPQLLEAFWELIERGLVKTKSG